MFQSKTRSIVIPQHEHLKMVGVIGYAYGNKDFPLPPISRDAFLKACSLHDAGYGYMDTAIVGQVDETTKITAWHACINQDLNDSCASIAICRHFFRLSHYGHQTEAMISFQKAVQEKIQHLLSTQSHSQQEYDKTDEILNCCDTLSYFFCFDGPLEGKTHVGEKELLYRIEPQTHSITINPWPFAVQKIESYIIGYQKEGYPQTLHPIIIPYIITP